jgi:hypothetical protein
MVQTLFGEVLNSNQKDRNAVITIDSSDSKKPRRYDEAS